MIDKIIKAVKSSNKRSGRNITIGTVIGFLLSCTVVMGAGEIGLEIGNSENRIEFKKDGTVFIPKKEDGSDKDPYLDNNWEEGAKTYTNNTIISGYNGSGESYGVKLSGTLGKFKFINNALITGTGYDNAYGIFLDSSSKAGDIINTGILNSKVIGPSMSYGVYLGSSSEAENIINTGVVTVHASNTTYGIYLDSSKAKGITNSGIISITNDSSPSAYGIYLKGSSVVEYIENTGLIYSAHNGIDLNSSGVGDIINTGVIYGGNSDGISQYSGNTLAHIINTGVIYGKSYVVNNVSGTITSLDNYGILATKGNSVVTNSGGTISGEKYYGLEIERANGIVSNGSDYDSLAGSPTEIIVGYDGSGNPIKRDLTIKNAGIQGGGTGIGTSTDSFKFSGNPTEFDNSILNGKNETLKVSGEDREVKGSIINAYGTAVVFGEADKKLTLSGTTVNGGVDEANNITVSGSSGGDTLILQSGEVEYAGVGKGTQNTIINGNIAMEGGADTITVDTGVIINGNVDMGDGDDVLNIANGGKINGTLDGKAGNDTLNFGENGTAKTRAASSSDEIRIIHNISGFEDININANVTLFEKTIGSGKELTDLTVTGAENITIGAGGVLTLRINSADSNKHALSAGNTGTIKSENGGKLLLALNGAGNKSKINFGNLELDSSLVTGYEGEYQEDVTFGTTSVLHSVKRTGGTNEVEVAAKKDLPSKASSSDELFYEKLNKIYHSILSVDELGNFNVDNDEKLSTFLGYLNDIYAGNPYSYSSELSRKSTGMFRDIVTDNQFKANTGKWMIYGGLTHVDGGTKDTYYGKGYYTYDIGSSDMDADTKITGAYMLGEYGVSDTLTSGVVIGGNKLKSDLSNGSKVDGSALYLGAYAKKYIGNLKVTAGAGFQYGDYDADRLAVNNAASSTGTPVIKYSDNYNDMTYDIYLNGRYSHNIGDNLFLEPYGTLSYTYIDQDGADEGNQTLAIETDSKSFDYTVGKVGVDLKKVIPHEKGKSTLSAGVSYTRILDGADEEFITGRFKGGRDFDILVAHKNEHSIGLNAKYALELENGILFDVKGTYAVERDSHNGAGKNKTKGEWIVGTGLGYKF